MNLSIPAAGMQAASQAFEAAATNISRAFSSAMSNPLSAGSTTADYVDISASIVALLKSNLDFDANVKVEIVENEMNQSTFSIMG
jgi:flagellar basal body rod protein FlgC